MPVEGTGQKPLHDRQARAGEVKAKKNHEHIPEKTVRITQL